MRGFWGFGAFVADDELSYRFAPDATITGGIEGRVARYSFRTNALGNRSAAADTAPKRAARLALVGASYMAGLGVGDDAALFHNRLQALLRRDGRWPSDVEVHNLSQSGYLLQQQCLLVRRTLDAVRPDVVVLVVRPGKLLFRNRNLAVVNGVPLSKDRLLAGTPLDLLRTRSYLWMRCATSPMLPALPGPAPSGEDLTAEEGHRRQIALLTALKADLDRRGVPLVCLIIQATTPQFEAALDAAGIPACYLAVEAHQMIPNDHHWNEAGHRHAAEQAAAFLSGLRERRALALGADAQDD
ncbi:MAG: hypothetical protein GX591_14745 [Planctomycetes bacterium]|nr:hypothetical protein [Planctomycetota bacterium]